MNYSNCYHLGMCTSECISPTSMVAVTLYNYNNPVVVTPPVKEVESLSNEWLSTPDYFSYSNPPMVSTARPARVKEVSGFCKYQPEGYIF